MNRSCTKLLFMNQSFLGFFKILSFFHPSGGKEVFCPVKQVNNVFSLVSVLVAAFSNKHDDLRRLLSLFLYPKPKTKTVQSFRFVPLITWSSAHACWTGHMTGRGSSVARWGSFAPPTCQSQVHPHTLVSDLCLCSLLVDKWSLIRLRGWRTDLWVKSVLFSPCRFVSVDRKTLIFLLWLGLCEGEAEKHKQNVRCCRLLTLTSGLSTSLFKP